MKIMKEFNNEVSLKTDGRVKFKMYPGGVQGDEKDVVRKIRIGQLHAGGFTGVGIGEIAPEIRILDTPFLFRNWDEMDYIYRKFDKQFREIFEKKGFVFLGWAEVGNVHIFTNIPVREPSDLKKVKMWLWEGDPIAEETFKAIEIKPIPLSITDVMTSLETGMINGVYASPLAAIVMQWWTKTKYVFSVPITKATGAVLVSMKIFNKLSPNDRKILLAIGRDYLRKLTLSSRNDNEKSIDVLKKEKLIFTDPSSADVMAVLENTGKRARLSLEGKLYSKQLLENVENSLKEFRNKPRRSVPAKTQH
jgi:TRAP-type C4-dicarboxylate transport system substrate-binding protein